MPKYPNDVYYGAVAITHDGVAFPSLVRTATQTSDDFSNHSARGVRVTLDITLNAGTAAAIIVTIRAKDPASGKYATLLASASKTAAGTTVLVVYPTITAAANTIAQDVLPQTWDITVTHADANPITYTVGYQLLP